MSSPLVCTHSKEARFAAEQNGSNAAYRENADARRQQLPKDPLHKVKLLHPLKIRHLVEVKRHGLQYV